MNPIPDRNSRLIKESILMTLAHLQFRLILTPGTGPNLSFPPASCHGAEMITGEVDS